MRRFFNYETVMRLRIIKPGITVMIMRIIISGNYCYETENRLYTGFHYYETENHQNRELWYDNENHNIGNYFYETENRFYPGIYCYETENHKTGNDGYDNENRTFRVTEPG